MAEENKTWWFGRLKIIMFAKDTSDTGLFKKIYSTNIYGYFTK